MVSDGWIGGCGGRQGQRCPGLSQVANRASDGSGSGAGDGVAGGLRLLLSGECLGKAGTVAGDGVHGCNRVVREGDTAVGRIGIGGGCVAGSCVGGARGRCRVYSWMRIWGGRVVGWWSGGGSGRLCRESRRGSGHPSRAVVNGSFGSGSGIRRGCGACVGGRSCGGSCGSGVGWESVAGSGFSDGVDGAKATGMEFKSWDVDDAIYSLAEGPADNGIHIDVGAQSNCKESWMAISASVAKAIGDDGSQMTLMGGWIVVVWVSNGANQLDRVKWVLGVIKGHKGVDTGRVGVLEAGVVGQLAAVEASSGVKEGR